MLKTTAKKIKTTETGILDSKLNTKKKMIIYISVASTYILAILVFGLVMDPDLYGIHYENKFISPSFSHIFGTDFMGRDMLMRCIKGLSNSIIVGLFASAVSSIIALVFGISAAMAGGKFDRLINWLVDCCMGMPHLVLLILISYMLGRGGTGVAVAVALTHWPELTRIVRAEVLQIRNTQYVKAAYKMGRTGFQVAKSHMIPHVLPVYLVGLVLLFPHAIMHEAALTFLGFGFSSGTPAIGGILSEAMKFLVTGKWWLCLFPGLMLLIVVVLFETIGDRLRKLLNPGTGNE